MSDKAIMEIRDLKKKYTADGDMILKGIDLTIERGDFIAIMGRSGCGKTTFLKTIGLIENVTEGEIYFDGHAVSRLWGTEISDIRRRHMGFIFQNYNLMSSLNVEENVMLPAILDKMDTADRRERTEQLIERFGIGAMRESYPNEISGGQQQRVALCRALINDPEMILGDEPTGNLDSVMGREVIETLADFNEKDGKTVVLVTHDPKIAMRCRTVVFMKDGRLFDRIDKDECAQSGEDQAFYRAILDRIDQL